MKLVADNKIPFLKGVLEPYMEVVYMAGDQIVNADLADADVLLTRSVTQCNEDLLTGTSVRYIASATIGDDHIDKDFCRQAGILWSTAKGCNAEAVNQYVQASLLSASAKLGIPLKGKTLAVIGVGDIGSKVCRSAQLLEMNVLQYDPPRARKEGRSEFVSLEEVFRTADFVSLHVPLTNEGKDKTHHLVDDHFLGAFTKTPGLMNTSRGAVADSIALKRALLAGTLDWVAIDVWENEPEIDRELLNLADIATPHIAGYSVYGKLKATAMTIQSVSSFLKLELDDWHSDYKSENKQILIDCKGMENEHVMNKVFSEVCKLENETLHLKNVPASFEKRRGNYIFRLENDQYDLRLENCNATVKEILIGLGFLLSEKN